MSEAQEIREWARSKGREVSSRGQIPDALRQEYEADLSAGQPGEFIGDEFTDADFEDLPDVDVPEMPPQTGQEPRRTFRAVPVGEETRDAPGAASVDSEPAHGQRQWRERQRTRRGRAAREPKAAPTRMTAGLRKDITAKIEFGLTIPGGIWQARDPLCGGVFMQQIPATATALADIVADSPDLIAFFAGPGGGFMKALALGAALMPVGQVMMAHHVYHTAEFAADPNQPEYQASDYAA